MKTTLLNRRRVSKPGIPALKPAREIKEMLRCAARASSLMLYLELVK
jgi:hypothetical protein